MKIRADEHISPKIVRAVELLVLTAGWELTHVRDHHAARTADETWIPRFAQEGGQVILSADRKILARPHQIAALCDSKLIGIFLPAKWQESRRHAQAAHILWWWPRIETTILESKPRDCWQVPSDFGDGHLKPIKINFAAATAKRQ